MPTPPYAATYCTVNGGSHVTGHVTSASVGDTIQCGIVDPSLISSPRWDLFSFPPSFACPSGWSTDSSTGFYYFLGATPPTFATSLWGKYHVKLTINGGVTTSVTESPAVDASLCIDIAEPTYGLRDEGYLEDKQAEASFGAPRVRQKNLRALKTALDSAGGGGVPTSRQVIAGTGLTGGGTLAADRTFAVAYGTSGTTACVGDDSRLSDARAPTGSAGGDLSGTYPNPSVAKIGGVPVSLGGAPNPSLLLLNGGSVGAVSIADVVDAMAQGATLFDLTLTGITTAAAYSAGPVALTAGTGGVTGSGSVTFNCNVNPGTTITPTNGDGIVYELASSAVASSGLMFTIQDQIRGGSTMARDWEMWVYADLDVGTNTEDFYSALSYLLTGAAGSEVDASMEWSGNQRHNRATSINTANIDFTGSSPNVIYMAKRGAAITIGVGTYPGGDFPAVNDLSIICAGNIRSSVLQTVYAGTPPNPATLYLWASSGTLTAHRKLKLKRIKFVQLG